MFNTLIYKKASYVNKNGIKYMEIKPDRKDSHSIPKSPMIIKLWTSP